jgi:hypothetical protein
MQLTKEQFDEAAKAIGYEIKMLKGTYCLIATRDSNPSGPEDKVIYNALIHSFLVAVRNLDTFFYARGKSFNGNPDMKPSDFLVKELDSLPPRNKEICGRISRRLMHLTWEDAEDPDLEWKPQDYATSLYGALRVFCDATFKDKAADCAKSIRDDVVALGKTIESARVHDLPVGAGSFTVMPPSEAE